MKRADLLSLNFYNYQPFHGSEKGLRYRVEKEDAEGEISLKATIWPEPFSFDHTPEDKKESKLFEFSEDGLSAISDWINLNVPHPEQ